jgi:hypothetical protein
LAIICIPLSLVVLRMLSWFNILDPVQLLLQLSLTKCLWLVTFFNFPIKVFLFFSMGDPFQGIVDAQYSKSYSVFF